MMPSESTSAPQPEPFICANLRMEKSHLLALKAAMEDALSGLSPSDPRYDALVDAIAKIDALIAAIETVGTVYGCNPAI